MQGFSNPLANDAGVNLENLFSKSRYLRNMFEGRLVLKLCLVVKLFDILVKNKLLQFVFYTLITKRNDHLKRRLRLGWFKM